MYEDDINFLGHGRNTIEITQNLNKCINASSNWLLPNKVEINSK